MLESKNILLGVTGGIAAYKAVEIARQLIKKGAIVTVAMTEAATRFVTPLTFECVTGRSVATGVFERDPSRGIRHISLGWESDAILIAPATANTIAKIAGGFADDVLTSVVLATDKPVLVAPSMNCRMFANEATERNIEMLRDRGYEIIEPATGWLACGEEGVGRLAEPEEIIERVVEVLRKSDELSGKTVLITAGGTREAIDPVRFIGNASSGLVGFEVARAVTARGARAILIVGTTSLKPPTEVEVIEVTTSREMFEAVSGAFDSVDALVMTAAVSDYKPVEAAERKIKKDRAEKPTIELEPTVDILKELSLRRKKQVVVGFAAETDDLVENARRKLEEKKLDLIVGNDVSRPGVGFGSDRLDAVVIEKDGPVLEMGIVEKREVAKLIASRLARLLSP